MTTELQLTQRMLKENGYEAHLTQGADLPGYWLRVWDDHELVFHARFGSDGREYGRLRLNKLTCKHCGEQIGNEHCPDTLKVMAMEMDLTEEEAEGLVEDYLVGA